MRKVEEKAGGGGVVGGGRRESPALFSLFIFYSD